MQEAKLPETDEEAYERKYFDPYNNIFYLHWISSGFALGYSWSVMDGDVKVR